MNNTLSFRKANNGNWVAYGPAAAVTIGENTVTKKNGQTSTVWVTRLGKPFNVDGVPHVYGYIGEKPAPHTVVSETTLSAVPHRDPAKLGNTQAAAKHVRSHRVSDDVYRSRIDRYLSDLPTQLEDGETIEIVVSSSDLVQLPRTELRRRATIRAERLSDLLVDRYNLDTKPTIIVVDKFLPGLLVRIVRHG